MANRVQTGLAGLAGVAALLATACSSMGGTVSPDGANAYSAIGCSTTFEDVMGDMMRLHDRLGINADQEFAWISYETAYERYADAYRFRELVPDNGIPAKSDGLRPLRDRVREARDELYQTLTSPQRTYLDMEACRLSYP